MRLLGDTTQLCRIALDMGGGVRSCDITDPYIVVLLNDGTVVQLCLKGEELSLSWPELAKGSKVTLLSAYTDTSGLFETDAEGVESVGVARSSTPVRSLSVEDEDELLYGDVETLAAKMGSKKDIVKPPPPPATPSKTTPSKTTPTKAVPTPSNWCVVYREDGSLEIYKVPSFRKVFAVRNFSRCPQTLKDSGPLLSE